MIKDKLQLYITESFITTTTSEKLGLGGDGDDGGGG
jgi:hypothetical protein